MAKGWFILQPSYEGIGVREIQDEGSYIGPPEGLERVSWPSGLLNGVVFLETFQEGNIVQGGENCR